MPGGRVLTGGMGGGGVEFSSPRLPESAGILVFGWFVQGFLSTGAGFFSSGRGIGEGSGVAEGCTVGASGISPCAGCAGAGCVCGGCVWLPKDCAAPLRALIPRKPPTHPAIRTAAIHLATTVRGLLRAPVWQLTGTFRSLYKALSSVQGAQKIKTAVRPWDA